jgi:hypothetical protein
VDGQLPCSDHYQHYDYYDDDDLNSQALAVEEEKMADVRSLTIDQGSTYELIISVVDANGAVVSLAGYSARGMIRKKRKDLAPTISFSCSIPTPTSGQVRATLTAAQTAGLTSGETKSDAASKYVYDFEVYKGDGTVYRIMEGSLIVSPEVTK